MEELEGAFPAGLEYSIVYNPTEFVSASIDAVYHTFFEAIILVVLVVFIFLQSWRAAIIPIVAIPVSLIGTFAVMAALGFSLNMLTLFGLILAIGIVVDDAIVVVENVERNIRDGMSPRQAAHVTMDEVGTRGDRHRPGAVRRVRADRLHSRHVRQVLPAVRGDHRRGDGDLGLQFTDAVAGARRAPPQAARSGQPQAARSCCAGSRRLASMAASTGCPTAMAASVGFVGRAQGSCSC